MCECSPTVVRLRSKLNCVNFCFAMFDMSHIIISTLFFGVSVCYCQFSAILYSNKGAQFRYYSSVVIMRLRPLGHNIGTLPSYVWYSPNKYDMIQYYIILAEIPASPGKLQYLNTFVKLLIRTSKTKLTEVPEKSRTNSISVTE